MSNLAGVSTSALSARLENHFALANLNFDFSLVKIEAPKEFHKFGQSLSPWRRKTAEDGSAHRTARKLGALFEQVVKPGKALVEAYGQRLSEISSQISKSKQTHQNGVFESQAGADGTAIWAAATSGNTAIAVVLLTCMLARMWDAPKATSIWMELIEKRKLQILETCDGSEPSHLAPIAAEQQEITRREIADWDASARAWLAIADEVKKTEHRRMESVLLRLSLPVDNSSNVFQSVMRAWNTSMATMDKLIKGMPQRTHDAAVLVGISAWHLYPDVELFGRFTKSSMQNDKLIGSGGCLTVGLEDCDTHNGQGVYWSLSLANLRFYGDPIFATQNLKDASRIPFDELSLVTLGSVLASWACPSFDPNFDLVEGAKFFLNVKEYLEKELKKAGEWVDSEIPMWPGMKLSAIQDWVTSPVSWIGLFSMAAQSLLEHDHVRAKRSRSLASLGVRRGLTFVQARVQWMPAFFGFADTKTLLQLQQDDDARIAVLRAMSQELSLAAKYEKAIIRYLDYNTSSVEYASVFPVQRGSKRDHEGESKSPERHFRWICKQNYPKARYHCVCGAGCSLSTLPDCFSQSNEFIFNTRKVAIERSGESFLEFDKKDVKFNVRFRYIDWCEDDPSLSSVPARQQPRYNNTIQAGGQNSLLEDADGSSMPWEMEIIKMEKMKKLRTERFEFLLGDVNLAALYVLSKAPDQNESQETKQGKVEPPALPILQMANMFFSTKVSVSHLVNRLLKVFSYQWEQIVTPVLTVSKALARDDSSCFVRSMQALSTAAHIYASLPESTVALRIIERKLWESAWLPTNRAVESYFKPCKLTMAQTFSCVAMFESGTLNIPPAELDSVFAISAGNSIYASTSLVVDPHDQCEKSDLRRIIGNVGRAGLTMLIPPASPILRRPALESWEMINHDPFSFKIGCENRFDRTSLHLSFTGYEQPVPSAVCHGDQDVMACYLETLVSVFDGSRKVGDVDILRALQSPILCRMPITTECVHIQKENELQPPRWAIVDSWVELLELPDSTTGIVRAHGDPIARLAATVASIQADIEQCVVLPQKCCYLCTAEFIHNFRGIKRRILIC